MYAKQPQPVSQSTNQPTHQPGPGALGYARLGSPGQPTTMQSMHSTYKQTNKSRQQPPLHSERLEKTMSAIESQAGSQPGSHGARQAGYTSRGTSFTQSHSNGEPIHEIVFFCLLTIDFAKWLLMSCAYKNNKHWKIQACTLQSSRER